MKALPFRSISFHQSNPDIDLIRLAGRLGFNNVELQTESPQFKQWLTKAGYDVEAISSDPAKPMQLPGLQLVRKHIEQLGLPAVLERLGLSLSLWTRELEDVDPEWGEVDPGNKKVWEGLTDRYRYYLGELFPEVKYLWVTIAETRTWITSSAIIDKVFRTINEVCREKGVTLVARNFSYEIQRDAVDEVLFNLPEDIVLGCKYGPRDWGPRGIPNRGIRKFSGRRQFIEEDIAGEYYFTNEAANCMARHFLEHFLYGQENGVEGWVLRVNRGWRMDDNDQGSIYGEVQESHLWCWAHWLNGRGEDIETPLRAWAAETFGEQVADRAAAVFEPTGEVIAECVCLGREPFGDTRAAVPAAKCMGGPCWPGDKRAEAVKAPARRYTDEEAEQILLPDGSHGWPKHISPIHQARSIHPFDPSALPFYHRARKGDPSVIEEKLAAYERALGSIDGSISGWEELRPELEEEAYLYFHYKLSETRRRLIFWCEAQLTWLHACRRLYADHPAESEAPIQPMEEHRDRVLSIDEQWKGNPEHPLRWRGRSYAFRPPAGAGAIFVRSLQEYFGPSE